MKEVVLGLIDIALIGGLLWSLWFVIRTSRRRRRQIADQLAAPIVRTTDLLLIRINRKEWIATTALMLFLTLEVLRAAITAKPEIGLLLLALVAPLLFASGREVFRRRPAIALDGNGMTIMTWKGMTLRPKKRFIPWHAIEDAWVKERISFGVTTHELVCQLVPPEEVEVPLERLSMPWNDVARAIQDRLGRRIVTAKP